MTWEASILCKINLHVRTQSQGGGGGGGGGTIGFVTDVLKRAPSVCVCSGCG